MQQSHHFKSLHVAVPQAVLVYRWRYSVRGLMQYILTIVLRTTRKEVYPAEPGHWPLIHSSIGAVLCTNTDLTHIGFTPNPYQLAPFGYSARNNRKRTLSLKTPQITPIPFPKHSFTNINCFTAALHGFGVAKRAVSLTKGFIMAKAEKLTFLHFNDVYNLEGAHCDTQCTLGCINFDLLALACCAFQRVMKPSIVAACLGFLPP